MDIGGTFSGFASAVAALFQFSRTARLRNAIKADVGLYVAMDEHAKLAEAKNTLAKVIGYESTKLHEIVTAPRQQRNPASGIVGLIFTCILALPLLWLIPPYRWWMWALAVLNVLVLILFLGASISAWRSPRRAKKGT